MARLLRALPNALFDRLLAGRPRKRRQGAVSATSRDDVGAMKKAVRLRCTASCVRRDRGALQTAAVSSRRDRRRRRRRSGHRRRRRSRHRRSRHRRRAATAATAAATAAAAATASRRRHRPPPPPP